jgi:hypothetical protein
MRQEGRCQRRNGSAIGCEERDRSQLEDELGFPRAVRDLGAVLRELRRRRRAHGDHRLFVECPAFHQNGHHRTSGGSGSFGMLIDYVLVEFAQIGVVAGPGFRD